MRSSLNIAAFLLGGIFGMLFVAVLARLYQPEYTVQCIEGVKWVVDKRGTLNQVIDSDGKGVKCEQVLPR